MIKKLIAAIAISLGMSAGIASIASASQAHPSPGSSCSKPGSHAVYYTPKTHKRDKLTCKRIHSGTHYRDKWFITGH
jgi:hypothetical protein